SSLIYLLLLPIPPCLPLFPYTTLFRSVPLALASDTSIFRVKKITKHLETNLFVTSKITNCKYGIGKLDNGFEVRIKGDSYARVQDRKSTRLNSSHVKISYAVFCLKKKK